MRHTYRLGLCVCHKSKKKERERVRQRAKTIIFLAGLNRRSFKVTNEKTAYNFISDLCLFVSRAAALQNSSLCVC